MKLTTIQSRNKGLFTGKTFSGIHSIGNLKGIAISIHVNFALAAMGHFGAGEMIGWRMAVWERIQHVLDLSHHMVASGGAQR